MTDELEIIGAASVGALARDRAVGKDAPVAKDTTGDGYLNGPCPNCGTEIAGEYCSSCGQSAKDMKKPFVTLLWDIIGDVFSFDGRLIRTVPALMLRPGHVTRSYLDGKRARYVPPFRLFLIASVVFFLVLFGITERQEWAHGDDLAVGNAGVMFSTVMVDGQAIDEIDGFDDLFTEEGTLNPEAAEVFTDRLLEQGMIEDEVARQDLIERLERLSGETLSRTEVLATVQKWAPRLSFLLLPFFVVSLTFMHFWIRRAYVYSHVIVALHLQTFFYFAGTLALLFSHVSPGWAWGLFGVSVPVYPFMMMGKSYGTNWFFNIFRTFLLLVFSFVALIMLIVAVSVVGANDLGVLDWSDLEGVFNEFEEGVEEGLENDQPMPPEAVPAETVSQEEEPTNPDPG